MSYIVLARKWRPQGFEDLIGQEMVATTLKNALATEKIVHAYLFSGPRGVGKTSSARILAKALNCEKRTKDDPCNACLSCKAITEGSSIDVSEIDGASNTSVDSIRELRETVRYAPSGGKFRIYIIDEVHMLSTPAFNALLKTLEEPPSHVIFIFATTEPKKIPATILSRCQHHAFRRISKTSIRSQLQKIIKSEEIMIKDSAIEMIARAADGSMRDALTLLDQATSFSDDVSEKELQALLGLPDSDIILSLSSTIISGDIAQTLSIIKELTDRGSDLRQLTKELVEYFRNLAVVKVTERAGEHLELSHEEVEKIEQCAAGISLEQMTLLLTELLKLDNEVRTAVNPRYTLELGLLRASFIKGMSSIDAILTRLDSESSKIDGKATSLPPAESAVGDQEMKKKTGADLQEKSICDGKEDIWKKLIAKVDVEDHLLACKLSEAKVIKLNDHELSIGFNGGMSVLADSIEKKKSVLKPLLQQISGHNLKVKILSLPESESKKNIKDLKKEVFGEPIVKDVMKLFNSSLIRVTSLDSDNQSGDNQDK